MTRVLRNDPLWVTAGVSIRNTCRISVALGLSDGAVNLRAVFGGCLSVDVVPTGFFG